MALPEAVARLEFGKIRRAELAAGRRAGRTGGISTNVEYARAVHDILLEVGELTANLPERASRRLASDIKAGRSDWRVRTGYSRSRFRGDERGIVNDASYAPKLEERYSAAHNYVANNLGRVAREIADQSLRD